MDNKRWFGTEDLAGLPGMPGTSRGVRLRARIEGWPSRKRKGQGGGREYPLGCLPAETQAVILAADRVKASSAVDVQADPIAVEVLSSSINGANFEVTLRVRAGEIKTELLADTPSSDLNSSDLKTELKTEPIKRKTEPKDGTEVGHGTD